MATTPAETTYAIAQCIHEEWQLQKDRNDRVAAWTGHKVCRSSNRTTAHPPIAHCRASPSPARGPPPTEVRSRTAGCGDLPRILRQDGPTINDHFSEIKEGEMVYGGQLVDKIRQATKAPSSKSETTTSAAALKHSPAETPGRVAEDPNDGSSDVEEILRTPPGDHGGGMPPSPSPRRGQSGDSGKEEPWRSIPGTPGAPAFTPEQHVDLPQRCPTPSLSFVHG